MMKSFRIVLFTGLLLISGRTVIGEMHPFELPDGRTIEAEIVSYNSRLGQVKLKRTDGKTVSVKPSIFVEEGQQYIQKWIAGNAFLFESVLKIKCDDEVVKKWKEEETQDVRYTDGSVEKDFIHNVVKYEDTAYNFSFKNEGDAPMKGLHLEYCIYYEQSTMMWEVKPEMEQKTFYARLDVPEIPAGGSVSVQTKAVMTYEDDVNPVPQLDGDRRRGGKGRLYGIRARLKVKGGSEAMRETSLPKTLSEEKYPWTTDSSSNRRKGYSKRAKK